MDKKDENYYTLYKKTWCGVIWMRMDIDKGTINFEMGSHVSQEPLSCVEEMEDLLFCDNLIKIP